MQIKTKQFIIESIILSTVLTIALEIITVATGHHSDNWITIAAVWTSFGSTWLCTRQVRFNYVFALVSVILLAWTFYKVHLYGSMALNLYLIPTVIYGWFIWRKDSNPKPVEHLKPRAAIGYVIATAVVWGLSFWTLHFLGGSLALLDAWVLVGNILGQWLMDRKKLENWWIWAAVNVISIYEYTHQGLYLVAGQYVLFLANSFYAWWQWNKTMKAQESVDSKKPDIKVSDGVVAHA